MKLVYLFDANGIYTGIYSAQQSPLEPGIFIVPELSTDIAPPGAAGTWPVFKSGAWINTPDHRGETHYDTNGDPVVIEYLGPVLPALLATPPVKPVLPVLPDLQGFLQAIKIGLGGIVAVNTLLIAYPAFLSAIQLSEWLDVQSLLIDALSKTAITPIQYAAIKSAAATYNIPVTL
jgi:hypothetical protein